MKRIPFRLLLAGAVAIVFGPVLGFAFVDWDDGIHLTDNPHLNPATTGSLLHFWVEPYKNLYIPVNYTAWWGLAKLSQAVLPADPAALDPRLFHASSLVLHAVAVLLVWRLLRRLLGALAPDGRAVDAAACAGALLFACHPLQAEPVAWASGTRDLLAGVFSLYALDAWVAFREASGPAGRGAYARGSVALLLALLSKPSAVVVAPMALVIDRLVLGRPLRDAARPLGAWLLASAAAALVASAVQATDPGVFRPAPWQRLFVAGDAVAFYLAKLVLPLGFAIDHGRTPERVLSSAWGYAAWLLPAGLLVVASLRARGRDVGWLAALLLFAIALAPVLGLLPFRHQRLSTVADRYAYLALFGAALALAFVFLRGRLALRVATGAALVALGVLTSLQVRTWRDSTALFGHAIRVNPRSVAAHFNLGLVREQQGEADAALAQFLRVVELEPQHEASLFNIGVYRQREGRREEAIRAFEAAIAADPGFGEAMVNLGVTWVAVGDLEQGARWFERALEVEPDLSSAAANLATVRRMQQGEVAAPSDPATPGLRSDGPSDSGPESR